MKEFYRSNLKTFFIFIFSLTVLVASAQVPNCATSPSPINGATLTRMPTFSWTAPTGTAATGYKVSIGTTTAANEILNPPAANVTAPTTSLNYRFQANVGGLLPGVTYYWKVVPVNGSGDATGCSVQSFTITAAGNPTVFPVGSWNAYCYNSNNFTNYVGYYTATGQDFDSKTSWTANDQAPSNTTATSAAGGGGAATYLGGAMSYDNHSVSYKRKGFTPGNYTIDVMFDDNCWVYVNGTLVYTKNGNTGNLYSSSVATLILDNNSEVEFRWAEGGGSSYGALRFISGATLPTLVAGVIAGNQTLCSGGVTDPIAFTSTTVASGTCAATPAYQWQVDVNCTGAFTDISGATAAVYDAPAGVTQTTCYRRLVVDAACNRSLASNTITVTVNATGPGDPTVFPIGSWTAYCYSSTTWANYAGYYTSTGQDFNSSTVWTSNNYSPSSASPNGATNYVGCPVPVDNHSISYKRQGFTPGTYSLNIVHDDACYIFLNGVQIYTQAGATGAAAYVNSVWTGNLDASSQIEFKWLDTGGGSHGGITFVSTTAPTLIAGTIAGSQSLCAAVSSDPVAFTSTLAGSGTCSATAAYQWQSDVNCTGTFTDIAGATAATYDAPSGVTQTTCYRRLVVDANCTRSLASNTITVTVYSTAPGDPTVFPANSWNGYVYGFASYNAADAGWTDYRGYFSYSGSDPSFNTSTIFTTANVPSSAPGFQGCPVTANLSGIQIKRRGFPAGTYVIDFSSDDAGYLYVNGVLVYSRATNGSLLAAWTGNLDATSTVELRYKNNTTTALGALTFNLIPTPTFNPGVIAGNQIVCPGNDPYIFTSTSAASGTCSAAATYQWQSDVNCTGTFTDISGATALTYDAPTGIAQTTCYRRVATDANCSRVDYSNTVTVTVTTVPQGDPTVFPLNSWNAYVYDFTTPGYTTADDNWTDYKGFFPINSVSFSTTTFYAVNAVPSAAPGYAGCQLITYPLTGAQIKRQGFPTGVYQIDFTSDDAGFLYINGVLVYSRTGNGTASNVWTGNLDASSTIDYRYKNNGGNGSGALTFTVVTPTIPLTEGGIALNGPATICPGNTATPIISTSDAASSCYVYYQWQADEGSGYADIAGATSASYTPATILVSTLYRRYVKDACGDDAYSNVVDITVGPSVVPDPTIFGNNAWIAYVYNQQNFVAASLYGSYTDPGVSSTDPSFNSINSWNDLAAPSLAATYTGCQVGIDGHSVSYKRQGFPAGTYTLNVLNDDGCQLYIDGVLVYARGGSTATFVNGVWTGVLGASTQVEFRWTEGAGNSHGAVTFIPVTVPGPLDGGAIANATSQVCSGDAPTAFTSTTLPSNGCAVATYQWQLDNGSGYTDISGATSVVYPIPVAQTASTSYRRRVTDACSQIAYSNIVTINVVTPTPPNPAVFGSNVWNVYAYNDVNFTVLRGSYVDNGLSASDPSFDSRNKWGISLSPSNAPGYTGCQTNVDQHGVIYKRQGFPAGKYRLDYNSDDAGSVYVNGVLVYTSVSYGTLVTNIWTGTLNSTSTIEYRWADTGGGQSYGQLVMVHPVVPATLVAGTIANSATIVCSGDIPPPFTSTADASGGCYKTYQWLSSIISGSSGFSAITGATSSTYTPTAITTSTYYVRRVTDACAATALSNVIKITVGVPSPPTLTWGDGQWNAYVYNGRNFTTLYGSYTENNISSGNYSFDTRNSWTTTTRPSTASSYAGCQVTDNTFSISFRQTNFVPGTYQIDMEADDDAVLIINGVTQYTGTGICCTPKINVWNGTLNASSKVEIRYGENNSNAYCKPTITSSTPAALLPGTIGTDQTICSNVVPSPLTSVANATSGCAITYQWQYSTTSAAGPWTNLGGATAITSSYTPNPPGLTATTYYIRNATDACGRTASSNVVTVTVDTKPNNAGIMTGLASVCSGQTGVTYSINPVTYATSYTWVLPSGATITSGAGTNAITVTFGSTSGDVTVQPTNACGVGLTSTISVSVTPSIPAAASAISGSNSVCQAQYNVLYSVPAVASASSYIWTLPTGATFVSGSTTNAPRISFGASGGTISVTPTNSCGNALTSTNLTVTLTPTPNPAGNITGVGTVCPGQIGVTYSVAPVTNTTTYNWSLPAGATITSGAGTRSIVVTFGSTSGNVTVTPTNTCGTGTAKSLLVSVVALGTPGAITGLASVCQNSTAILYTVPVVTGASTYTWTVPPGATITSGGTSRSIRVTMGTTSGDVTVTPSNACTTGTTSTRTIAVTNSIPANATAIIGDINPCRGQTGVTYSTTSTGATSYTWTVPSGSVITSGANTNIITVTIGANSGNITVTPSNVCGNATAASQVITVSAIPTATAGGSQSVCTTGTATVSGANSTNGTIAWTHNGGGSLTNETTLTPTYTPVTGDAGNAVILTMTVSNSPCTAATAIYTVNVKGIPTAAAGGSQIICSNGTATVSGATSSNGTISWTHNGAGSITGGTTLTPTYTAVAGDAGHSVVLTMTVSNSPCTAATAIYTITPQVIPTALAGTDIMVCEGSIGNNITAGASASNYSNITWSSNGTGTFASANSLTLATYTPSTDDVIAGSRILTLTATGTAACSTATATLTKTITIHALPVITGTTPGTHCGTGTVSLAATSSAGTLDWYAASSGGTSLGTGISFVTPSISATTVYYVEATNLGCPSARTAVTATIDNNCAYTWTGGTSTIWGLGSNWSTGNIPTALNDIVIPSTVTSGRMPEISTSLTVKSLSNAGTITFTGPGVLNVSGDISNTGTITTVSGSTINLVGTTAQTITGLPSVYNLGINNSNGVSVATPLTVNGTLSLVKGVLTTNNKLTINFDADGNIGYTASDLGTVSGNVSGVRNLVARTHYISVPFEGITSGQINTSTVIRSAAGAWLMSTKKYDTQGWTNITNYTTVLSPISGYSLALFTPATLTMSGSYTHGASSSYSSANYINTIPSTIHNGMYMMVGNPYPSTLDWDNATGWTKTNINDAIYLWNPVTNSVASYVSGVGTSTATQYIGAMQSFLVKVTGLGGTASVLVNNNARVLTHASYYRTSSNQLVRLVVKNAAGTSADETVVRIDDLSTENFDSDADASKIKGGLSLYTKTAGSTEEYSINTLPITGPELLVPLNLKVAVSGLYTIECSEYSVPGYSLVLEDKQTATYTLLDNSTIYTINANKTDSTNRFVLRFVAGLTTGVVSGSSLDMQISTYDNQLMLNVGGVKTDNGTIRIYDASGLSVMELKNQSIVSGIQVIALPGLSQGVYIAKVEIDGTTYVGKVVLK